MPQDCNKKQEVSQTVTKQERVAVNGQQIIVEVVYEFKQKMAMAKHNVNYKSGQTEWEELKSRKTTFRWWCLANKDGSKKFKPIEGLIQLKKDCIYTPNCNSCKIIKHFGLDNDDYYHNLINAQKIHRSVFTREYPSNNNNNNPDDKEALLPYPETSHDPNLNQTLARIRDGYDQYNDDDNRSEFFVDYDLICCNKKGRSKS